jgi:PhoPQ-activated pathogenicity-related protein
MSNNSIRALILLILVIVGLCIVTEHTLAQHIDLKRLSTPTHSQIVTRTYEKSSSVSKTLFTSGWWQGKEWRHELALYAPKRANRLFNKTYVVIVDNYRPDKNQQDFINKLTNQSNTFIAHLSGIPNQPLFNRKEGELLTFSFRSYLETKDASWPLLIPMVRAIRQSMNIIQNNNFTKSPPESFILIGSSKRAWSCYLTAGIDTRVSGLVALAFNMVNFTKQIENIERLASLGLQSAFIKLAPYKALGLLQNNPSNALLSLYSALDPFSYRSTLTMPKLLITGSEDPYWAPNSWDYYVPLLPGKNYVFRAPKANHSLFESQIAQETVATWVSLAIHGALPRVYFDKQASENHPKTVKTADGVLTLTKPPALDAF